MTSRFVVANTAKLQLLTVMRKIAELKSRLQRTNPVEAPTEVQPDVLRAGAAGGRRARSCTPGASAPPTRQSRYPQICAAALAPARAHRRTVTAMTDREDDDEALLTPVEVVSLQRRIEAGVLARAARLEGTGPAGATEVELRLVEADGEQARQRFIRANLRLVRMVARQVALRSHLPEADLFQEGCVGLITAVSRFDHTPWLPVLDLRPVLDPGLRLRFGGPAARGAEHPDQSGGEATVGPRPGGPAGPDPRAYADRS